MDPSVQRLDEARDYAGAIKLLKESPTYDASYFYNLGALHAKQGKWGQARAYLLKSGRLSPHHPQVISALQTAESQWSSVTGKSLDPASTSLEKFSDRLSYDEALGTIGLLIFFVALMWSRSYLKTRHLIKTFLRPAGWVGSFMLISALGLYGVFSYGNQNPPAIVLEKSLMRSGPGSEFPEIGELPAGSKVRMDGAPLKKDEFEVWQKVRFDQDASAWIPLSQILVL